MCKKGESRSVAEKLIELHSLGKVTSAEYHKNIDQKHLKELEGSLSKSYEALKLNLSKDITKLP
ncbi:hypothetical protein [Wolbachia endosymbiont of Ctenocephalides felis wCfeT]|uniref:hypothetical protein n=1 Tax=Wolbachia endosymbiont of Ctenocephalides felis wCfeT TaxID=2732593 RepID=UPI0014468930|nr:hypothetical protein [Wolbachia endosymbiont of Ctenocephalides felis wCfeT]